MAAHAISFKPPTRMSLGDYDLDAFVVESYDEGPELDFRFELGMYLSIYWALPAGPNERLRLAHVDGAAYHVDEPTLIADPFCADLPQLHWPGNRAPLTHGRVLISATIDMLASPGAYRCELVVEAADGRRDTTVLHWRA